MILKAGTDWVRVVRTPGETWVCHGREDGTLSDVLLSRDGETTLYGSIHLARLKLRRGARGSATAILHSGLEVWIDRPPPQCAITGRAATDGALIAVRVIEEARSDKLAKASGEIEVRGRRLNLIAGENGVRISHRISDRDVRARVIHHLKRLPLESGAWLATRWAHDADQASLDHEAACLEARLNDIHAKAAMTGSPIELMPAVHSIEECLAERVADGGLLISCNTAALKAEIEQRLMSIHSGDLCPDVTLDLSLVSPWIDPGLSGQMDALLDTTVSFEDGQVHIEPTQALTAIDVDADPAIGFAAANKRAAKAVVEQLRLRDMGGIFVVDPAGSGTSQNAKTMTRALEGAATEDPCTNKISAAGSGLVSMVRERRRPSLRERLAKAQVQAGEIALSAQTRAHIALARRLASQGFSPNDAQALELAPEVAQYLMNHETGRAALEEASAAVGHTLRVEIADGSENGREN